MNANVFVRLLAVLALIAFIVNASAQDMLSKDIETTKPVNPKLEHVLDSMALVSSHTKYLAKEYNMNLKDNSVQVIINLNNFTPQYLETLENAGAVIEVMDKNLVQARVPISKLNTIASLPFVNYIRKPEKLRPSIISEGVATINATILHNCGFNGSGIKIAVLDVGFADYQYKLGTELPTSVVVKSFRADGDITGGGEVHGTAVAETVHDVAPEAQLYLVNSDTRLETNSAVNWLISENVDIISHSAGWSIGPKDGTDYADEIVNNAAAAGILWVNSAGNNAYKHWMGDFYDPDDNEIHNFASNDETNAIFALNGMKIVVHLDWDDWPYSTQDYDLYLLDSSLETVAGSENWQNGTQEPFEELSYTATYTGNYYIIIYRHNANRNVQFHLYSPANPNMEYIVPAGSIAIPGTSTGSLTVGATHWSNDALESYSSHGPTDDGRIKPDVVAPSSTTNSVYGTFAGTSASAPHVSGAAALLLGMHPGTSVNQLKQVLEDGTKDLGVSGKDNQFGAGRIDIYKSSTLLTNQAPMIESLSPLTVTQFETVQLTVTAFDPEGQVLSYAWDFDNDGVFEIGRSTSNTRYHIFTKNGLNTIRVHVDDGVISTEQAFTMSVTPVTIPSGNDNDPVISSISPVVVTTSIPAVLTATAYDADSGTILYYTWDSDGDGTFESGRSIGNTVEATFTSTNVINVRVDDDVRVTTQSVTIAASPTGANALPTFTGATPTTANVNVPTTFTMCATDNDKFPNPISYMVDANNDGTYDKVFVGLPDATRSIINQVNITFTTAGTHVVPVRVDDGVGTNLSSFTVVVS